VYEYSGVNEALGTAPPTTQWIDAGNAAVAIATTSLDPLLQRGVGGVAPGSVASAASHSAPSPTTTTTTMATTMANARSDSPPSMSASSVSLHSRAGSLPALLPAPLALASAITPSTSPYASTSVLASALRDFAAELPNGSASTEAAARSAFESAVRRCWMPSHGFGASDVWIETVESGSALAPSDASQTTLQLRLPRHMALLLFQLLERRDGALKELGVRAAREVAPPPRRPAHVKNVHDWLAEHQRKGRGKAALSQLRRTLAHAVSEGSLFRPALRRSDTSSDLYTSRDGIRFGGGGPRRHHDGSVARGYMTRDAVPAFAMGRMIAGRSGVTGA
jgi:hypothetical protein